MKANADIRRTARASEIPLWEIAAEIGISENTLIRWLREELTGERLERVETALRKLTGEGAK